MLDISNSLRGRLRTNLRCVVFAALIAFADLYCSATPTLAQTSSLCETSVLALREASEIRGLTIKGEVPCTVQDKPAVEAFLHETIASDLPPQKLQMEEIVYKSIGLIPESFEYSKGLVGFLVSQIGGYYDPKRKRFVMAAWLPAVVQRGVAVHELTHALQDQHFDLLALLKRRSSTTDSDIATSALVEGDASAVMYDSERRALGQPNLKDSPSVDSLILIQILSANVGGIGGEVPDSLKSLLIFPYTTGLRFAHALLRAGGYARVTQAYSRVPTSSREVLHPEEYLAASFTPRNPSPEELPGATSEYVPEYTDVIGEFAISSLFNSSPATKSRAASIAQGWVGDRVGVFPLKNNQHLVSWLTRWESQAEAKEFFDAYTVFTETRCSKKISPGMNALSESTSIKMDLLGDSVVVQIFRVQNR